MRQFRFGLAALLVLGLASVASAEPFDAMYREGTECPADSDGPFGANPNNFVYSRQYSVSTAERCVFIDVTTGDLGNPTGTNKEAADYLNSLEASLAGWGTILPGDDWKGILGGEDRDGFSFTGGLGGSSGSFLIGDPLTTFYDQFAIAVKDGGDPKFAIFMLPVDVFSGDWSIGPAGGLSHFALYGRVVACPDCVPDPTISEIPEPASLLLTGAGLAVAGKIRSRKKKQ